MYAAAAMLHQQGGVLARAGHTEAALDLARLAGAAPCGVLCEITTADGRDMARLPELKEFCKVMII
jgi:3,4-dihydroxy-2-butanone 4-phosphate synthase